MVVECPNADRPELADGFECDTWTCTGRSIDEPGLMLIAQDNNRQTTHLGVGAQ